MKVLIIGSGGREHTLAWKITQSPECEKLYVAPGNGGTEEIAENVNISADDFNSLADFIKTAALDMVVIGPEDPLARGIRNYLEEDPDLKDLMIIGPSKDGALLESSKDFSKNFMTRNGIPTANAITIDEENLDKGLRYLTELAPPIVLKADGLAAGKGVLITRSVEEAQEALKEMILKSKFGEASKKVLIEEYLQGIELSVFVVTDGKHYKILPEAKDYKRIGENDTGPNTGGMGAVSPVNFADTQFMTKVENQIIQPTIDGLAKENISYSGFIFFGLMNVHDNPFVIEYNVRMGDPEAQVVIPRIKTDLLQVFKSLHKKELNKIDVEIDNRTASTVVLVSGGYPGKYEKGKVIKGLEHVGNSIIFHAGTKKDNGDLVTNGGRVLAVTGMADDLQKALELSYNGAKSINWDEIYFRTDIGKDLLLLSD